MKAVYLFVIPIMLTGLFTAIVLIRNIYKDYFSLDAWVVRREGDDSDNGNQSNWRYSGLNFRKLSTKHSQTTIKSSTTTTESSIGQLRQYNKTICRIPLDLDPFSWQFVFETFIENYSDVCIKQLKCSRRFQKDLIEIVWNSTKNTNFIRKNPLYSNKNLSCFYGMFEFSSDNSIVQDKTLTELSDQFREIQSSMETKFVEVICVDSNVSMIKYQNAHVLMPNLERFKKIRKKKLQEEITGNFNHPVKREISNDSTLNEIGNLTENLAKDQIPDPEFNQPIQKPNILILSIESLSRLNFLRSMPQTKKTLESFGPVFYMKGLTRIADNTFPNMMAFATGSLVEDYNPKSIEGTYDKFPFLWRRFEERGYPTALIDDDPPKVRSTFNYHTEGFRRPPTTFYPHPFWVYWQVNKHYARDYCLAKQQPIPEVLLDQVEQFQRHCRMNLLPYFILSMNIYVTHDCWTNAKLLDQYYVNYLNRAKNSGILNDTVIIMMGDHGDRFSRLIETNYGKIESRLPLFAIQLPESLHRLYPEFALNLLYNRKRLSTVLDMNRMLLQFAELNLNQRLKKIPTYPVPVGPVPENLFQTKNRVTQVGEIYSPITEKIPIDRTAAQARIPTLYSVCDTTYYKEIESKLVEPIAHNFVTELNQLLPKNQCQPLWLLQIVRALVLIDNDEKSPWLNRLLFGTSPEQIELTVVVGPSGAMLRTILQKHTQSTTNSWTQVDKQLEIERLNLYGNQSHCIDDRILRKYCLCHDIEGQFSNHGKNKL